MPTVYVETYGCQMNVADTDLVLGLLERAGYGRTDDPACADVILINTCAVRERAVERVRGRASTLAQHKNHGRRVVLGITGCMAEHLRGELRQQRALRGSGGRAGQLPPLARAHRARARRRGGARYRARSARDLRGPRRFAHQRRRGDGPRRHPARLRPLLHLLRGALHARPRARHRRPTRSCARRAPWRRAAAARCSCSARPSIPTAPVEAGREVGFAELLRAGGRGRRHRAHPLHVALPARLHRRGHRRHGRAAQGLQARAPAPAVGVGHGARAHEARLHLRRVPRPGRRAARRHARDRHHHRLPGRLLRRERGASSRKPWPPSSSCASTTPSCSPTRSARGRPPRASCPTTCRPRSSSAGWRA